MYCGEKEKSLIFIRLIWHICITQRLQVVMLVHLIDDLLKVHLYSAALDVRMLVRTVDQNRQLLGADLLSSVSKHKEHGVDHVGLATAVRTDDAGEALMRERSDRW